jgi:poly(3-hydroxybutyrate) depolymerase
MNRKFTLLLLTQFISLTLFAQVKSNYLYSTSMPYGTLDIRTKITSTHYYYLQEGKTFSFRESSPGVRTNTYRDMTTWGDSGPYKQGNLRLKNGTSDKFVMNYRLLPPVNYSTTYAEGYPLIVIMHGAGERGNCLYSSCYHSNFSYDPNVNSPAAPKTVDHRLLNNDHNLNIGGKEHLAARNLAGTKLPNDPALAAKAFSGFVLVAQMLNEWEPNSVQHLIRIIRLHCEKYKIDPNRIYIHGLSIGGYAVYEAIKRAPWLFAAALPMSAVSDAAGIFTHNQQGKVAHIPLWAFQGGNDTNPTPAATESIMSRLRTAGGTPKYTLYSTASHNTWGKAYGEAEFYPWMKSKNKANLHPSKGITVIIKSKSQYPKLMLAEGFLAYQWEKNGVVISGATTNTYTATTTGTYRARFSRISSAPTASQWNRWSAPVTVTETTSATTMAATEEAVESDVLMAEEFSVSLYPNPTGSNNLNVQINAIGKEPVEVRLIDQFGEEHFRNTFDADALQEDQHLNTAGLPNGVYVMWVTQGKQQVKQRVMIKN